MNSVMVGQELRTRVPSVGLPSFNRVRSRFSLAIGRHATPAARSGDLADEAADQRGEGVEVEGLAQEGIGTQGFGFDEAPMRCRRDRHCRNSRQREIALSCPQEGPAVFIW